MAESWQGSILCMGTLQRSLMFATTPLTPVFCMMVAPEIVSQVRLVTALDKLSIMNRKSGILMRSLCERLQ